MLVDEVQVELKAGSGGTGIVWGSFVYGYKSLFSLMGAFVVNRMFLDDYKVKWIVCGF